MRSNSGCGYHGKDGLLYCGSDKAEAFCPTYSAGDIVGGGVNYASQIFFFTKIGELVGTMDKDVKGPLFLTIAVHSQKEEVPVNFGLEPFVFGVKAYETQERARQQMMIEKISLSQDASYGYTLLVMSIICSCLLPYGYENALKLLDMASNYFLNTSVTGNLESLCEKDIMQALDKRNALQQAGKLEEAVVYGRTEFEKLHSPPEFYCLSKDSAALLAFEEPNDSVVGYLLKDSHKGMVAGNDDAMILSTNSTEIQSQQFCLHSDLNKLLRQLSARYLEMRALNGKQGEDFSLSRVLGNYKTG